jgi:protein-tyrosine phosphatase
VVRVVFVCTGNICRSPSAEAVLKQRLHEAGLSEVIQVSSAGMAGWHVGKDADPRSLKALRARGYDLEHSARQVRKAWVDEHDLWIAMDSGHLMELRSLLPGADVHLLREWDPRGNGNVPDPYYDGEEAFEEVLDIIERSCAGLAEHLQKQLAS